MAIAQSDLDLLNTAMGEAQKTLEKVLQLMASGESLVFNSAQDEVQIVDEAVGTASSDGDTKGDFELNFPVDALADIEYIKVGAAAHEPVTVLTSGDQVVVELGDVADAGELTFDSAKTGAITAKYKARKVPCEDRSRGIVIEDETAGYVTSVGNNVQALENMRGLLNPGHFTSSDAV